MSTHSRIAIEHEDGSITAIYCNFDGYNNDEGVGVKLRRHYNTQKEVMSIISLGDLSSLEHSPEESTAYHRDRGEPKKCWTYDSKESFMLDRDNEQSFNYLFESKGEWIYCINNGPYYPLK